MYSGCSRSILSAISPPSFCTRNLRTASDRKSPITEGMTDVQFSPLGSEGLASWRFLFPSAEQSVHLFLIREVLFVHARTIE